MLRKPSHLLACICKSTQIPTRFICSTIKDILKKHKICVLRSTSLSIFENLAIEDWLFENINLTKDQKILLMWRNKPCVVIGKFQNPWCECNVSSLAKLDVSLARRKSGGGAVYHDLENVNCSFITHRETYNRKNNLNFIITALMRKWSHLNLSFNARDDILLDGKYKISGTAAKLTQRMAYHHCTLLVNVNRQRLNNVLKSTLKNCMETSASSSVSSPTNNLSSKIYRIGSLDVIDTLGQCYDQQHNGLDPKNSTKIISIGATEAHFPGITNIIGEMQSWEWTYVMADVMQGIRYTAAVAKVRGTYPYISDIVDDVPVVTECDKWQNRKMAHAYRPVPRPLMVDPRAYGCRPQSAPGKLKEAASQYHSTCIPADKRPTETAAPDSTKPFTKKDFEKCDQVSQDKIWRQAVDNERKGLKQWEQQWGFMTEFDSKGNPVEKVPLPEHESRFSNGPVPNTNASLYGSRVETEHARTMLSMEHKLSSGNRKKKLGSEMICY